MSEKMIAAAKEFAKNKRGTFPMMKFSDFPLFFQQIRKEQARYQTR
ncbi:hypothetical protein RN616_20100 (plasmid) [Morganella morganii]|nr:hypothetical protein [Morganella morganii]WNP32612.1 hypothetical protein RN616_20100 [Morganella morganii]HCR4022522.1 hypothetical protein [Morganella morganii]